MKRSFYDLTCRSFVVCLFAILFCAASAHSLELGSFPLLHPFEGQDKYFWFTDGEFQGVCNAEGKVILPARYSGIEYVGEDRFISMDYSNGTRRHLLFNERGKCLFQFPDYFQPYYGCLREGAIMVQFQSDDVAYVDRNGRYIVRPGTYKVGKSFSQGLAAVEFPEKDGTCGCGYVNQKGDMQIGPFHDSTCDSFMSGVAAVDSYPGGKRGLLGLKGKFVVPQEFDLIQFDNESKLKAVKNGQNFVITLKEGCAPEIVSVQDEVASPAATAPVSFKPNSLEPPVLKLSHEQFDSLQNLFASNPQLRRQTGDIPREFSDIRRAKDVFLYLQQTFGFVGMFKKELERRLGAGQEVLNEWTPLAQANSRYALQYSLNLARCGNAAKGVYFSIDGNGRVDGWALHEGADPSPLVWHTSN